VAPLTRGASDPTPVVIPDGRAAPARPSRNPRGDGHRPLQVRCVGWVPAPSRLRRPGPE